MSQHAVSADTIPNSAVGIFSRKTEKDISSQGADKLVTTQIWKLKNLMSLFSDAFSLLVHFEFFAIFSYCLHFAKFVCLLKRLQRLKQEAEKSSWDQPNIWKKLGLVWRNRKKICQIIKDYFYLPFYLLIIL